MATSNITIRMDSELKAQAEALFGEMGMNLTTAYTVFTKAAVRQWKMPFELTGNVPSAELIASIEEGKRLLKDPNTKRFTSVAELLADLDDGED